MVLSEEERERQREKKKREAEGACFQKEADVADGGLSIIGPRAGAWVRGTHWVVVSNGWLVRTLWAW